MTEENKIENEFENENQEPVIDNESVIEHFDEQTEESVLIADVSEQEPVSEPEVESEDDSFSEDSKFKWYCLRTYTGHEQKVKLTIETELKRMNLDHKAPEIIIPQETVFEVRNGKRRTKIKNFLPGYIVIKVDLDKKMKDIIQNLPSVVSFVGTKTQPAALRQDEIERIIGRVEERKSIATIETTFEIGDPVKVIDGPFSSFNGTVKEVNFEKQKLKVEVGILGRKTPVELDFSQVEMENH